MSQDVTDNLLTKTDLQHMLEFETQIFLDIVRSDGLVIAAKYEYRHRYHLIVSTLSYIVEV